MVDFREGRAGKLLAALDQQGLTLTFETLSVGDYVCGKVGIERKSDDFLNFDQLVEQAKELKQHFGDKAFIVVDCNLDLLIALSHKYHRKDMTDAILGMVASLTARLNMPPLFLSNADYTAYVMKRIFEKGNDDKQIDPIRPIRPKATTKDRMVYILTGLPGVDLTMAKRLLEHFKTVQNVMNATQDELLQIKGIGDIKAKQICEVVRYQRP